jgi:hypothetical protein
MRNESSAAAVVCLAACLGVVSVVWPVDAQAGVVISVPSGGDLQAAINAAAPGDTIQLQPGGKYVGNFVLPVKTGTAFVTIRTAPDPRQPADGVRVNPSHAPALALVISPNSQPALKTAVGAHHYRLMLLEVGPTSGGYYDIIQLGYADSQQTSLDQVPYSLVLDRLYIHGDPLLGQKRGIALNSASTDIVNCYISDIKAVGQDTQAIAAMNGPGPYRIENNYLEAAAENFMAGGADPTIANLMPSDITFRYNHLFKPVSWRSPIVSSPTRVAVVAAAGALPAGTYTYRVAAERVVSGGAKAKSTASAEVPITLSAPGGATVSWAPVANASKYYVYRLMTGSSTQFWTTTSTSFVDDGTAGTVGTPSGATVWSVKNIFELKNARRVLVERNVMENIWQESQTGYAVLFTPRNTGGTCTWCAVEDVTFRLNVVRHAGSGVSILGWNDTAPSGQAHRITIVDNLFYDVSTAWGGHGWFMLIGAGPADVVIDHNTIDHEGSSAFMAYGSPVMTGIEITNNLMRHNNYGINGNGTAYGNGTLAAYFITPVVTRNVFAGGPASRYPADNLFTPVDQYLAQFVAPATGDFSLVPGSSYIGAGLDGKDLGANISEIQTAATAALSGMPPVSNAVRITTTSLPRATVGAPFDVALTASGGDGQYVWSIAGAMPAGVQFNRTTGVLSGVSAEYGSWSLQVTAASATNAANSATAALTLSVWPLPIQITSASLPVATKGRAVSVALFAKGGTGSYRWRVVAGALPQGVTLDAVTGTLSGTPTVIGTSGFTVQAVDATYADVSDQAALSMTVAPPPVAVMTTALADGVCGISYTSALSASGGGSPLTWKVSSGALPAGLTMSTAGQVTGTPSATGTSNFTVTVTDSLYPTNLATAKLAVAITSGDIVLYARRATVLKGTWQVVGDATAAGGANVGQPDAGAAKVTSPVASPVNYFELPFTPAAGRAYHLWIRGKAQNNSWANDSVFVQFSGSLAVDGTPTYRIGTTSAASVNLEDDLNKGVSGWGWQDNGYGANVLGPSIYFDGTPQRLRIQTREDGFSIDQIVLSAVTYTTAAPGALKNDTTILPESVDLTEVVMRASSATAVVGTFHKVVDATAADGLAVGTTDAGLAKIASAAAAPVNYVELRFQAQANTPYRLWMRGKAENNSWANDSVFVQFSNSVDVSGAPIYRIGTTSSTAVILEDATGAGVSGWGWQDNGWGVNALGALVYFASTGTQTIRIQVREDGYEFDQIVLSSKKYLAVAPGALKDDVTILK